jgi:hypothetical protein
LPYPARTHTWAPYEPILDTQLNDIQDGLVAVSAEEQALEADYYTEHGADGRHTRVTIRGTPGAAVDVQANPADDEAAKILVRNAAGAEVCRVDEDGDVKATSYEYQTLKTLTRRFSPAKWQSGGNIQTNVEYNDVGTTRLFTTGALHWVHSSLAANDLEIRPVLGHAAAPGGPVRLDEFAYLDLELPTPDGTLRLASIKLDRSSDPGTDVDVRLFKRLFGAPPLQVGATLSLTGVAARGTVSIAGLPAVADLSTHYFLEAKSKLTATGRLHLFATEVQFDQIRGPNQMY